MEDLGPRMTLYIKDEEIRNFIRSKKNRSDYVTKAIRFYLDNKDFLARIATALEKKDQNINPCLNICKYLKIINSSDALIACNFIL